QCKSSTQSSLKLSQTVTVSVESLLFKFSVGCSVKSVTVDEL
ncbi:hypothetical protein DOY81_011268, partial [Sarcophaga bullata]